ncbi:hypothetical protein MKX03_011306, partial [Papaver bracteatum]
MELKLRTNIDKLYEEYVDILQMIIDMQTDMELPNNLSVKLGSDLDSLILDINKLQVRRDCEFARELESFRKKKEKLKTDFESLRKSMFKVGGGLEALEIQIINLRNSEDLI